jgi:hypothetical protein
MPVMPHPPPTWAGFMPAAEWRQFVAAVEAELQRRGVTYRIADGYVWAPWGSDREEALSLLNLAQLCHAAGVPAFPRVITAHFDALVAGRGDRELADELVRDLARARPHLKLRLYPRTTFDGHGREFVAREVADGLFAVLCFDLPSNVVTVHTQALARWGCSEDEVWYQALANLRRSERLEPEPIDVGGARLLAMTGDSFFVASNLLLLGDYLPADLPYGALACVPNRHTLVMHPIVDPTALWAIDALVVMANDMSADGPGAISSNVFWWRGGELTTQPTSRLGEQYEFAPTEDFIAEVLDPLAKRTKLN